MSYHNGPRIVTDGLVLCLDAGNSKSYPGSGTSWNDLSGNNSANLVNTPIYSSNNKGSIVFDGVDDNINLGTNFLISRISAFSISFWLNPIFSRPAGNFYRFWGLRASGATPLCFSYTKEFNFGYSGLYIVNNSGWLKMTTSYFIPDNIWSLLTFTYNGLGSSTVNNFKMYHNTSEVVLGLSATGANTTTSDINIIGSRSSGSDAQNYIGRISYFCIHSKALSLQEVNQNYNALKGRFNL